jgi:transcription antitermination factor NusA-like protein
VKIKMETPICLFCLRSGVLCPKCKEKVISGEISQLDINIMRLLLEEEKDFPILQSFSFIKAIEINSLIVIVFNEGSLSNTSLRIISKLGKSLESKIGKKIRFIENIADERKFIEKIVFPARVITINKIWLPDGSIESRVILDNLKNLKIPKEAIITIAEKVKGLSLRIDSEEKGTPIIVKLKHEKQKKMAENTSIIRS